MVQQHEPNHRAADAARRDLVLTDREIDLARLEANAAAASSDPLQRTAHLQAAAAHQRSAASHSRDRARHLLEAEVDQHGLV